MCTRPTRLRQRGQATLFCQDHHSEQLMDDTFSECDHLTDASVIALAERCPHLADIFFVGCHQLTDASEWALGEHCSRAHLFVGLSTFLLLYTFG